MDVFSPVLTEIEASEKLYGKLSDLTTKMPIGRLYFANKTVWASVPVFGRDFQATHLMLAVQVMTGLADELDDRLHGEFGGKRFFVETDTPAVGGPKVEDDIHTGMYLVRRVQADLDRRAGGIDQAGQHDHALRRDDERLGSQALQRLLKVRDVGGAQVDQGVRVAGDRVGADHLGMAPGRGRDLSRCGPAGAEQFDERLGGPADRGRVDDRGEALDHAGRAQPINPPLHRRCGE